MAKSTFSRRHFFVRAAGLGSLPVLLSKTDFCRETPPLGLAVAGAGETGRGYLALASATPGVTTVCGICDRNPRAFPAALEVTGSNSGPRTTLNFEDLLSMDTVEAIMIATPPPDRTRMAFQAMEAGKHVFIKPPWALSEVESHRLADVAQRRGLVAMQAPNSPDWDTCRLTQELREVAGGHVSTFVGQIFLAGSASTGGISLLDSVEVARRLLGGGVASKVSALRGSGQVGDAVAATFPFGSAAVQCMTSRPSLGDSRDFMYISLQSERGTTEITIEDLEGSIGNERGGGVLFNFASLVRSRDPKLRSSTATESHAGYVTSGLISHSLLEPQTVSTRS